ncbi:MAG: adenylyl-sulfate kinase, partial [Jatrophihabitantaceae bacterium]
RADEPLRLPVQVVLRPDHSFRGFAGSIVRGQLRPGDPVRIQPAGTSSRIARLLGPAGELELAETGQAVTVTLTDEVDVSRGDLIASPARPAAVSDQFQVDLVWMSEQPLMPGRQYRFKHGTRSCLAVLSRPKYKIDVNTLNHIAATTLQLNDIAVCELSLDREIAFDPYDESRAMGSFLIIDRQTEDTLGAGMLRFALRRSSNVGWQSVAVDQPARAQLNGHRPCIIWLTGLSGAGKSTLANLIERQLHSLGVHSYLLDGDNLRHGLNHDLGFAEMDRVENVRRVGEVARLMVDAGLVVLVSLISPFRDDRDRARRLVEDGQFCEVFVDTPLAVAEARDPKGLYAKARSGALPNFTGIDSEYQPPLAPEVHVNTAEQAPEQSADLVIGWLRERGVLG